MTKSGNTIGTFQYIAPERLGTRDEEDARADIYSLACVLYECLAGDPPFAGDTMARLVAAHLSAPPPRPSISQPDVPPQVDEVIATGMAKDPDQRYATTIELADAARDAITAPIALPAQNLGTPAAFAAIPAAPTVPATEVAAQQPAADLHLAATPQASTDTAPAEIRTPPRGAWWSPRGRSALIAAIIVAVVVLVSGVIIFQLQQPSGPAPSAAPTTQAAPPPPPPPPPPPKPVEEAALQGLLLSPDQINTAMGATGMTVTPISPEMGDDSAEMADKACQSLEGAVMASVYARSGSTAFREQVLDKPGAPWPHLDQGVVLFSSAHDASAFFATSAQSWLACSNREYTYTSKDSGGYAFLVWSVGPVSNTSRTLSATASVVGGINRNHWKSCQRALTVANNVVIDVMACSQDQSDYRSDSAVNVAHQIAAKVPT
jgi:serine/threonine kinase PknH